MHIVRWCSVKRASGGWEFNSFLQVLLLFSDTNEKTISRVGSTICMEAIFEVDRGKV